MNCGCGAMAAQLSFQMTDGGSIPTHPLQFIIRPINHKTAKLWVEKWHYSKRIPTGKNICYGLFANGNLYAVIVYGIGVNPYQAKFLGVKNVIEIKRMCRSEPPIDGFPLSKFISITSKMVAKECKFDCIVAFADPEQGHEGTVYKASNFTFHGKTNPEWHLVDVDGNVRHRRFAYRHARRNNISVSDSRKELKLTRIKTLEKYRWVRFIKTSAALKEGK